MQQNIPIIVTQSKDYEQTDRVQIQGSLLTHIRQNRNPTIPKVRHHKPTQLQTLDHEPQSNRTRRISSSAASKRFPKDFFKEDPCVYPARTSKSKHKHVDPPMLDTFSRKQFIIQQLRGKLAEGPDTPKFKEKKQRGLTTLQAGQNTKISHFNKPLTEKYNTCPDSKIKMPLLPLETQETKNQEPSVSNFNLTLGMKDTLTTLLAQRRRGGEKENCWGAEKKKDKNQGFRIKRKIGF